VFPGEFAPERPSAPHEIGVNRVAGPAAGGVHTTRPGEAGQFGKVTINDAILAGGSAGGRQNTPAEMYVSPCG
jgi:hypothetical protein